MQALALGAKCGAFGANGLTASPSTDSAASKPSSFKREASASIPMPLALVAKKFRRDWRMDSWNGCIAYSRAIYRSSEAVINRSKAKELLAPRAAARQKALL